MVTASRIHMSDLSGQRRYDVELNGDLTPAHTVGQAVEHYREKMGFRDQQFRWMAFSRGIRLDAKQALKDLPDTDEQWTVMPEASAGRV